MRTLITGGAGFIGSHLVDELVRRGDECTVLDDLSRGRTENLDHLANEIAFIQGSVTDHELMAQTLPGHDRIFHLASVVGVRSTVSDPLRVIDVTVTGTLNVLRFADTDAKIVVASSSEVYGCSLETPFDELSAGLVGPPTNARWSYAHAKSCAEHLALNVHKQGRNAPTVVRYFNVYGPRMPVSHDPSVISSFLEAARSSQPLRVFGSGLQTRSFVYVSDAVSGTIAAAEQETATGRVINLGGPQELTIHDLATLVLTVTGSKSAAIRILPPATHGTVQEEPMRRSASGQLASELLNWRPQMSLEAGLKETWNNIQPIGIY